MTSGHRTPADEHRNQPAEAGGPGTNPIPRADPADAPASPGPDPTQPRQGRWRQTLSWARRDGWLPATAFVVVLAVLLGFALHQWRAGRNYYDGAYFSQAAWLISHGQSPVVTIRGVHMFADHAYYVFYPIAYLTRPFPNPLPVLLTVQAVALAAAVFPLAAFARGVAGLGTRGVAAVLGAYALYPALQNVNAAEYHPESTAVPFVIAGALFCAQRRWAPYALCVVVVLLSREDLAIPVATAGLIMVFSARLRAGLATVAVAGLSLAIDLGLVIPHFADGQDLVGGLYAKYGGSTGALARYTLEHPLGVARDLLVVPNLMVVIALLAPVCFLSLAGWKWVLPALPLQLLYLLSSRESAHTILVQYVTQAIPFVFLGFAVGLGRLSGRRPLAVPLAVVAGISFLSYSVISPIYVEDRWRAGGEFAVAKREVAGIVPEGVPVTATEALWSVLAQRQQLYPYPQADPDWLVPQPGLPDEAVCWAAVERDSAAVAQFPLDPAEWELVHEDDDFAVYRSC